MLYECGVCGQTQTSNPTECKCCGRRAQMSIVPTPAEIARRAAVIREGWTERDEERKTATAYQPGELSIYQTPSRAGRVCRKAMK